MLGKEELLHWMAAQKLTFGYEEHERVLNMAESGTLRLTLHGARCKNLLVQDKQGQCYLIVTTADKSLDLAGTAKALGSKRMSFASAERMHDLLGVRPGSLSPLALANDKALSINLIVDSELAKEPTFLFHPLDSTATVSLPAGELERFLDGTGHRIIWAALPTRC